MKIKPTKLTYNFIVADEGYSATIVVNVTKEAGPVVDVDFIQEPVGEKARLGALFEIQNEVEAYIEEGIGVVPWDKWEEL